MLFRFPLLDAFRRFAAAARPARRCQSERAPGPNPIFRMRAWPRLHGYGRTAEIYRLLSVMSSRPVNRQWLLSRFKVAPQQLDALMQRLVDEGSVEVIDPAGFARGRA